MMAGTFGLIGLGVTWMNFDSAPPRPLEETVVIWSGEGDVGPPSREAREWEAVLDRGDILEARIPRTSKGFRQVTLFSKTSSHRLLAEMARGQLAKDRPDLSFGDGPGVGVPLDRLEIWREPNGDLRVIFHSPLGALKSRSPLPRGPFLAGSPTVVFLGPLKLEGDMGAASTVEAVVKIKLNARENRLELDEAIIRVNVSVPKVFINTTDEANVPPLSAPLSPVKKR